MLLLLLLSTICSGRQEKQAKQLDSIFSLLHTQNQFNGSVLIAEKGKVIFEKGYGFNNETGSHHDNDPQTIFELASCSKPFTAMAIILLKREGKLRYEDPVSKYLPELAFWDKVTIADLLRHTSGIPNDYTADLVKNRQEAHIATNEDVIRYCAARKDTLLFAPKSRHQYNNNNYVFLASIIARVSGMSYSDFLSRNIFTPLGMRHTFVYNRRQQPQSIKNYATGYIWDKYSLTKVISENAAFPDSTAYFADGIVGAAKVNANVEDLYRWVTALKNHTLLTPAEFAEMTAITQTTGGEAIAYGFGLNLSKGEKKFSFGHTGNWDGYVSLISHNMIKDRTIIILENLQTGVFPFENITQILDGKPVTGKYRRKIALPEAAIQKFTGVYADEQDKADAHIITCHDGHLFYNAKSGEWDMRFFPVADNEFSALRPNGADGTMRFTMMANGGMKLEMLQGGTVVGSGIRKVGE